MDPRALAISVVFGLMVVNQIVTRTTLFEQRPIYLALQASNAGLALWIAILGFPGFDHTPIYRFALAGVFVFRFVWNHYEWAAQGATERREAIEAERERLRAGTEDDAE